jgi:hypothetical protein
MPSIRVFSKCDHCIISVKPRSGITCNSGNSSSRNSFRSKNPSGFRSRAVLSWDTRKQSCAETRRNRSGAPPGFVREYARRIWGRGTSAHYSDSGTHDFAVVPLTLPDPWSPQCQASSARHFCCVRAYARKGGQRDSVGVSDECR